MLRRVVFPCHSNQWPFSDLFRVECVEHAGVLRLSAFCGVRFPGSIIYWYIFAGGVSNNIYTRVPSIAGLQRSKMVVSSVYLVEGAGVPKTAVPYFVYNLLCMGFILASWPRSYRQDSPSSNTLLMLLCKLPLTPPEELARPPTFPTKGAGSNLSFVSADGSQIQVVIIPGE